ncbi:MAG: hypothetical protein ACRDJC_01215, partial [Thermomicrobiales bacterium]
PTDEFNRNDCELKCGRCRIREKFCIVEGDPNNPDNIATCCFEHQTCCRDPISASGLVCVDTKTDIDHCGHCENPCPFGMVCVGGRCSCPDGKTDCPDGCVDTLSDPRNCRGCGDECPEGWECCGGDCADTQFSPANCGFCDSPCPIGDGAPSSCCNGVCTNKATDGGNCGQCGRQCEPGQICCRGNCWGADVTCCPDGFIVCGGDNVCCQDADGLWGAAAREPAARGASGKSALPPRAMSPRPMTRASRSASRWQRRNDSVLGGLGRHHQRRVPT